MINNDRLTQPQALSAVPLLLSPFELRRPGLREDLDDARGGCVSVQLVGPLALDDFDALDQVLVQVVQQVRVHPDSVQVDQGCLT